MSVCLGNVGALSSIMADEVAYRAAEASILTTTVSPPPPSSPAPSRADLLLNVSTQRSSEIRYILDVIEGNALWLNVIKLTAAEIAVGVTNKRCAELFATGILLRRIVHRPDHADIADAIISAIKAISSAATSSAAARIKLALTVVPTRIDAGVPINQAEAEVTVSSVFTSIASSVSRFAPPTNAFDLIYSRIPAIEYDYKQVTQTILESTELLYQKLCDPTVETTPIPTVLAADVAIKKFILNSIAADIQTASMKRIQTMDGVRGTSNTTATAVTNTTANNTNNTSDTHVS